MELSGFDIDVLNAFLGKERLKRLTIRFSFARGPLSFSRNTDMIVEMNYPPSFGSALANLKFAMNGILKLRLDIETLNGVKKSLSVFINGQRVLIFEE